MKFLKSWSEKGVRPAQYAPRPQVRHCLYPIRLSSAETENVVFTFLVVGVIESHYASHFILMSISQSRGKNIFHRSNVSIFSQLVLLSVYHIYLY